MNIKKQKYFIAIFLSLLFYFGCNKQSIVLNYDDSIIREDVDGYSRDMLLKGDTLFVISEGDGLLIYKLEEDYGNNAISLDSVWSNLDYFQDDSLEEGWNLSEVIYASYVDRIIILNLFYDSYYIELQDLFNNEKFDYLQSEYDNEHQVKLTYNDNSENLEIFSLVRNKSAYSKTDIVSIYKIDWDEWEDPYPNMIIDSLNYDATDIHYNNKLFISHTSNEQNEFRAYKRNDVDPNIFELDTVVMTPLIPKSIYSSENFLFVGMDDHGGVKIYSIDSMEEKSWISEGFSVRDIYWEQTSKYLLLSCGYQGVVVLQLDENMNIDNSWVLTSSYAYAARKYNDHVLVSTRDGIEMFNIK